MEVDFRNIVNLDIKGVRLIFLFPERVAFKLHENW